MTGNQLHDILKQKGIKYTWVAEQLNVSQSIVSQWIKGTKPIPEDRSEELKKLFS